jgi:hypothetical protein
MSYDKPRLYHEVDTYSQRILKDVEAIYRGGKVVYERHGAYMILVGADADDVSDSQLRSYLDDITELFEDYGFSLGEHFWFDFYDGDVYVAWQKQYY